MEVAPSCGNSYLLVEISGGEALAGGLELPSAFKKQAIFLQSVL